MKHLILTLLLISTSGCAYNYRQPQPQQTNVDQFAQHTNNLVKINNSLAQLISSAYPMYYAISYIAAH